MSFTQVFGGTPIQPSQTSYSAIALSSNVTLAWPLESASASNLATMLIDVTPTSSAFAITLPDATLTSNGSSVIFNNKSGSFTFLVKNSAGSTLATISTSGAYFLYVTDNSTAAGTWDSIFLGGSVAPVDPAALAGYGLTVAPTAKLGTAIPVTSHANSWVMAAADRGGMGVYTGGAGTWTLGDATALGNNYWSAAANQGTGQLIVTPVGGQKVYVNGVASATLTLNVGESAVLVTDGSNWFTESLSRIVSSSFTSLTVMTTGGTTALTVQQAGANQIIISGALVSNATLTFPGQTGQWWMLNQTTGSNYTLTCKVAGADPGVTVPQGGQMPIESDATTMYLGISTVTDASLALIQAYALGT